MKINDMPLAARLGFGFGTVLLLLVAIAAVGVMQLERTASLRREQDDASARAQLVAAWREQTELNLTRTMVLAKGGGAASLDALLAPQMKASSQRISELGGQLSKALADHPDELALLQKTTGLRKSYITTRDAIFARLKAGDAAGADSDADRLLAPASNAYLAGIQALGEHMANAARERLAQQDRVGHEANLLVCALTALALALGAVLSWLTTRSVTLPLKEAIVASERVAGGDLTHRVTSPRRDEVGQLLAALDLMSERLQKSIGGVLCSSDSIRSAAVQIASGNLDLSQRTEQAAASLQQTAAAMSQLTGTVGQGSDAARQACTLAGSAAEVARRGGSAVSQVVSTMDEINVGSKKIADIVGVIDSIAFQTNILALNAAVEAARAGEQGRGFAVVATEVRSLAGRSSEAARQIRSLIGSSVEKVESGARQVADAGQTMQEIVASVQRVGAIIDTIANAANTQNRGISEINGAISELDRMTQQNAALVEESAAAAGSMRDQADQLSTLVAGFRLGNGKSFNASSPASSGSFASTAHGR